MPIVGRTIERYGASKVTMVGAIFVGLGYDLSGSATSIPQLVITYGAFGQRHYSRNYGLVFTAFGVGALLGTWLAGSCMDVFGSYRAAFLATAVLSVIGGSIAKVMLRQATQAECCRANV
jgi:MFS transporter, OFA family, oxalate/formate antiporter